MPVRSAANVGAGACFPLHPCANSQNTSIGDTCKEYALRKPASKRGGASLIEVRPPPFPDVPLALAGLLQAKGDPHCLGDRCYNPLCLVG